MKKNKGFTLVELIIVMACLGMVTLFFWSILSSSSEDSYTLNEKMEVQNSVTMLMNIIEQDAKEAKIYNISATEKGILDDFYAPNYKFNNIEYSFNESNNTVTRKKGSDISVYNNIISFSLIKAEDGEKYGVEVKIIGGKEPITYEGLDKSRYTLNSTFYTRNTI